MGLLTYFTRKRTSEPATQMGGILTGHEIDRQVQLGNIKLDNYDPANLNPNSYNLVAGSTVTVYKDINIIDLHDPTTWEKTQTFSIDEEAGFVLRPGTLYLIPSGVAMETDKYEPLITGRSSIGRLGIAVHQEAGFGDIGFKGVWTLQVKVTYPTRIYPRAPIFQVYFLTPHGKIAELYNGKYQNSQIVMPSRFGM